MKNNKIWIMRMYLTKIKIIYRVLEIVSSYKDKVSAFQLSKIKLLV